MPRHVTRSPPEEPPRLSRLPHISAPVDEHPLVPAPPRPWWDRVLFWAGCAVVIVAVLAWFFTRASALR